MKNIKVLIGILIGTIITFGLISYAYKLNANDVTYDKKTTTLESNTVSGAIDELGVLATTSMSEVKAKLDNIEQAINNIESRLDDNFNSFSNINKLTLVASSPGNSSTWNPGAFSLTYNNAEKGKCYVLKNDKEMYVAADASYALTGAEVLMGDYLELSTRDGNYRTYVFYILKATSETIKFNATSGYSYGGALGLYEIS